MMEMPQLEGAEWCSAAIAWEKSRAAACRQQGRAIMASDVQDAFIAGAVAGARMAREDAAKLCEKLAEEGYGDWKHATPTDCAAAIRKG